MNAGQQLRRLLVASSRVTAKPASAKNDYRDKVNPRGAGDFGPPRSVGSRPFHVVGQGSPRRRRKSEPRGNSFHPRQLARKPSPGTIRSAYLAQKPWRSPSHIRAHLTEREFHPVSRDWAFLRI